MRYFSTQRPLTPGAFPKPSDNRVIYEIETGSNARSDLE